MRGTATSINFGAFSPRQEELKSQDISQIKFLITFELKISDFITTMNNNNPATVPKIDVTQLNLPSN